MKKAFVLMAVAAVAMCATSCKKDGVYKPGKQIAQILRVHDADGSTSPYETWVWNGNLLDSITYHWLVSNGEPGIETFTYDGNRLVASDYRDGHATYIYDGKRLVRIAFVDTNPRYVSSTVTYDFEYDGKQVSTIIVTTHAETAAKAQPISMLRMLLPEPVCEQIRRDGQHDIDEAAALDAKKVSDIVRTYKLTWEGSNVVKVEVESHRLNETTAYTSVIEMTYDDMNSPYRGLRDETRMFYDDQYIGLSSNNMLTYKDITMYPGEEEPEEVTITKTYKYDEDGYPVECFIEEVYYGNSNTGKLIFEYK